MSRKASRDRWYEGFAKVAADGTTVAEFNCPKCDTKLLVTFPGTKEEESEAPSEEPVGMPRASNVRSKKAAESLSLSESESTSFDFSDLSLSDLSLSDLSDSESFSSLSDSESFSESDSDILDEVNRLEKFSSIIDRLDELAGKAEKVNPKIASKIDRVTNELERRVFNKDDES